MMFTDDHYLITKALSLHIIQTGLSQYDIWNCQSYNELDLPHLELNFSSKTLAKTLDISYIKKKLKKLKTKMRFWKISIFIFF